MNGSRAFMTLLLTALLVTAGCVGDGTDTTPTPDNSEARAIQSAAVQTMGDVETYHVEMEMQLDTDEQSLEMHADSAVNRSAERLHQTMRISGIGQSVEAESYAVDGEMYTSVDGRWQARTLPENFWSDQRMGRQADVLEQSTVRLDGTETVDGVETDVLRVDPPTDLVKEVAAQQNDQSYDDVSIEDVTYTYYVAQDTDRTRKVVADMTMSQNGETVDTTVEMRFSEYGTPVHVELPEDAPSTA